MNSALNKTKLVQSISDDEMLPYCGERHSKRVCHLGLIQVCMAGKGLRFGLALQPIKACQLATESLHLLTKHFSRLARPLQHQRTLINWGDANSQSAKEGGSFEECDAAKPRKNVMQLTQVLNAQNKVDVYTIKGRVCCS